MNRLVSSVALLVALLAFAHGPVAGAQAFSFSAASYFEGITSGNLHLDLGSGDFLDVRGMTVDPHDGALVGVGRVLAHDAGVTIDDGGAQFRVTLERSLTPSCWAARSAYVSGVTVAGAASGTPYAIASTSTELPPGSACPYESILAEAAVGAPAIRSTFSSATQRLLIRRLQRSATSFGALKSAFR